MPEYEQAVFISYAWGGEREDIVNQIDEMLQKRGIKIIRDKRVLGYRGSIKEFMERIGQGNCVILVISDKYLRSPNCMFELVEVAENKQFHDRIFPIVLSDANIYDPVTRIGYVKYWETKRAELAKAMKELDPANLQGIRDDMDLYDRIRVRISGITSILKDMNTLTPDMHRDSDFSYLYNAIVKRMEESPIHSAAKPGKLAKDKDEHLAAQKVEDDHKTNQFETEQAIAVEASDLLLQGKQRFQNKDWQGAAQIFRQVLVMVPNHTEAKKLLLNAEAQIQQDRELMESKIERPVEGKKPVQKEDQPVDDIGGSFKKRFSRKAIIISAVASIIVLAGVVGAAVLLSGNKPDTITSVGMVEVPSGSYVIGTNTSVELADFWIDRYEVTNSNYKKFVDETNSDPPEYWMNGEIPAGLRDHPVRQITWKQADEYCTWAGKRLPTEAEWEIAARGPFGWKYPWGNDPDKVKQETKSTQPVDSNPANRSYFGAYFMSGNVWEWVSNPYTTIEQGEYVLRGGAYGPLDVLTYAIPVKEDASVIQNAGFRCAASGENVKRQYDDNLALDDDFESTNTNWPGIHEDKFLFDYHELGFYHVEAREPNKYIPAFYEHDSYSNFVVETGVFVDKANTDNEQGNFLYGLGVQITDDQFYAFVISAKDQNWQVLKGTLIEGANIGNATDLTVVASGSDSSIQGASTEMEDRLAVIANDTELMYYINGNLIYIFTIEAHQKVLVGFVVETLEDVTKVHIHYNWIQLQKIEPFDNGGVIQEPTPIPATPTPTPTSLPTATPTFAPPVTPFVRILDITIDEQQNYVVEYETYGYTETLPGMHIHFFFDTVPQEQAGRPGSGPWILYGGPRPFTKYRVSDRPAGAMQMCALVANSNHSVQQNSGNCVDLP